MSAIFSVVVTIFR